MDKERFYGKTQMHTMASRRLRLNQAFKTAAPLWLKAFKCYLHILYNADMEYASSCSSYSSPTKKKKEKKN